MAMLHMTIFFSSSDLDELKKNNIKIGQKINIVYVFQICKKKSHVSERKS
jgi:hypothetical protein